MTTEEWERLVVDTRDSMALHVGPCVTPISRSESVDYGWLWGTGNYVEAGAGLQLITNEHVAAAASVDVLAHLPTPGMHFARHVEPFVTLPHPEDVAKTYCGVGTLGPSRRALVRSDFDDVYRPVDHEILFWIGFPGSTANRSEAVTKSNRRYSWFGELEGIGVPVAAQEMLSALDDSRFIEAYHVLVHYPHRAKTRANGDLVDVPHPSGMSGSFLWDTKRVCAMAERREWSATQARVCGLIWGEHTNPDVVVATRVERVLPFIFTQSEATIG